MSLAFKAGQASNSVESLCRRGYLTELLFVSLKDAQGVLLVVNKW